MIEGHGEFHRAKLVRELLAALCSTSGKYLAAVLGCHSLTEAMHLLTMQLLGLIGSEHVITPPELNKKYSTSPRFCREVVDNRKSAGGYSLVFYRMPPADVNIFI